MSPDAWITLGVVVGTVALLVTERFAPAVVVAGAVVVLLLVGVIDVAEAFAGFSNPAPITVAALYVLAGAAERTGAIGPAAAAMVGSGAGHRTTLARLTVPTAAASAFLNNTPIVAMLAPQTADWAKRTGRAASRYLIPISYASMLGGLITAIGTSTNLVVSGFLEEAGHAPLGLFEITRVGLPLAVAGILAIVAFAPYLLADRRGPRETLGPEAKEFTIEMVVATGSPLVGRTVSEAGLRDLEGVFLAEIERAGHLVAPVAPGEVLAAGDRLLFAGNVGQIMDLQHMPGLEAAEGGHLEDAGEGHAFFEAVISPSSPLVSQTLKEADFRARYGGAVLAIHRAGARVPGKLGSVPLRAADVLLVLAEDGFRGRWNDHRDFLVVSRIGGREIPRSSKAPLVAVAMLAILLLAGTGLVSILKASLGVAIGLIVFGVVTPTEARRSLDTDILLLLAASFGLGAAVSASGLAGTIADLFIGGLGRFGDVGALAGVLVATLALTELITNNAAAALMFPVALATASSAGLNPRAFAIAVAVGASASFLTPIGYQTNAMVYGIGGYRFGDFTRAGFPLTIVVVGLALVLIPIGWPLR